MTADLVDLDAERTLRGRSTERWVTKQAVAAHFGVSLHTVRRWTNDSRYKRGGRQCPHSRRIGPRPKYQLSAVGTWLELPEDPR